MIHFVANTFRAVVACALCCAARADEPASEAPKPIPQTRPEVKQALEALKQRQPRLPLPPPTAEEVATRGDRISVNNGRMRALYLPKAWSMSTGGGGPTNADSAMTLDYPLKTECFWIVSRGNNCQYCLGHQEHKLATVGLSDNRIASLDADWSVFLPMEQAAFALARKLTLEPNTVVDTDVDALRKHFTDKQIVELVYTIAGFNSTNRWTDSMGIPQDQAFRDDPIHFDAPVSERFLNATSLTAPNVDAVRPRLEARSAAEAALSTCQARAARVPLAGQDETLAALPAESGNAARFQWVRALAWFPKTCSAQVAHRKAVAEEGRIDKLLKAQIAWTCARHDRAWYALGDARRRLAALDQSTDDIFAIDEPGDSFSPAAREALAFAAKLTAAPHTIADADLARLRKHFSDYETAEVVYVVCNSAMFDRFTETLGLPSEN